MDIFLSFFFLFFSLTSLCSSVGFICFLMPLLFFFFLLLFIDFLLSFLFYVNLLFFHSFPFMELIFFIFVSLSSMCFYHWTSFYLLFKYLWMKDNGWIYNWKNYKPWIHRLRYFPSFWKKGVTFFLLRNHVSLVTQMILRSPQGNAWDGYNHLYSFTLLLIM